MTRAKYASRFGVQKKKKIKRERILYVSATSSLSAFFKDVVHSLLIPTSQNARTLVHVIFTSNILDGTTFKCPTPSIPGFVQ
jgi:hypothetical protein